MSALTDLQEFAARAAAGKVSAMRDEIRDITMDPATIRHAAVLILFGSDLRGADAEPEDCDVLLVERAATLDDHPGQIGFPGGGLEPQDADESSAALREAVEETGLDPAGVQILAELPATGLPVSNFMVTPVLAWWAAPSEVFAVDLAESARVFRAPLRDLLNPELRRTSTITRGSNTFRSPAFLVQDAVIWGFTGGILNRLFDELGWSHPWDHSQEMPAPL
ncbi:8-oxo-dGTP pyrophosphatase MutT (NUDIX family) [Psychromicrobium silvestre]|uniref:8-oxo-dGTP pyrophosphatase MutT (NUDIX family) n=1 Tax=Psychromicrobium silvestre TaxID=1645614 RepID=A0A7Y9LTZ7_9MICC|nr:CoA pyrophosphatase [Psychromicrobium silvestre]NYE95588.1 8-oxo-dGTP pyrophosphatase MutT (NUDIX family) [Psychromicrobium silvestre]